MCRITPLARVRAVVCFVYMHVLALCNPNASGYITLQVGIDRTSREMVVGMIGMHTRYIFPFVFALPCPKWDEDSSSVAS